ncbi:beta-glucosidase, partial [Lachnospiraceae bacterium 210521-DFI.3.107]|nr:beta-glucosidase [Lachnospiraceae bacterium 210521-DFI.3.107]
QAVRRTLIHKFRLGLFENPFPMEKEERDAVIQEKEAQTISRNMAREAMILLKNDGVLPLKNAAEQDRKENSGKKKKVAVIGWHGGTTRAFMGCYMYIARIENSLGGVNTMAGIEGSDNAMKEKVPTETYPGSKILMEHPQTDTLIRKCYPGIH